MKYKIRLKEEDEDEFSTEPETSINDLKSYKPFLVKFAQKIYDDWNEEDRDTYAGGGICHIIAEEIAGFLNDKGIETTTVSSNFEQHVYCVSKVKEGIYTVDIHWSWYETGGGFSWKKIPNVVFDGSEVEFYRLSSDINDWEQFTGEYV